MSIQPPPFTHERPVSEVLHGQSVVDPYRWLEDQESSNTREWIGMQTDYARRYLDRIEGRSEIRKYIREFLTTEDYDSPHKAGNRYFYRKRLATQEQGCICVRDGANGPERILVNPADRGTGSHTAVKPFLVSSDGRLLLYEVKEGGERASTFEILDVETGIVLPETFGHGHLHGFAFSPNNESCIYVYEPAGAAKSRCQTVHQHRFGTPFTADREVFRAEGIGGIHLCLVCDSSRLGFLVYRFLEKTLVNFFVATFDAPECPRMIVKDAPYRFYPFLISDGILALTDFKAPNWRVVRVSGDDDGDWRDIIPESQHCIVDCRVIADRILVRYARESQTEIGVFDFCGTNLDTVAVRGDESVKMIPSSPTGDELFLEQESFTEPTRIFRYSVRSGDRVQWTKRNSSLVASDYSHIKLQYLSNDGTKIPILLMGRRDVLEQGPNPVIMTSYGGFGLSMTPQFSVFVAFLVERGCVFAMPGIRGGAEFGTKWHEAAKRLNRQKAYDDFIAAADWLVKTGRTSADRLGIFGGSNSGLLVGAAITQRPDLFRAVVCMVPLLDMLRYHLFDCTDLWRDEYGTAEDPDDFAALLRYSPYHQVKRGVAYPAIMIVSGDADQNCNPMHARKMIARLQAANASDYPILLSYNRFRGHSPVLPLTERIEALTDRMAFLCDQLQLPIHKGAAALCHS